MTNCIRWLNLCIILTLLVGIFPTTGITPRALAAPDMPTLYLPGTNTLRAYTTRVPTYPQAPTAPQATTLDAANLDMFFTPSYCSKGVATPASRPAGLTPLTSAGQLTASPATFGITHAWQMPDRLPRAGERITLTHTAHNSSTPRLLGSNCITPNVSIPPGGYASEYIYISSPDGIADLNVGVAVTHTSDVSNLSIYLYGLSRSVPLYQGSCSGPSLNVTFDDEGTDVCSGNMPPAQSLSVLDRQPIQGYWSLQVFNSSMTETAMLNTGCLAWTAGPNVRLVKTGPPVGGRGATLTYTLAFSNSGPLTAVGVAITDSLPAGLTPLSVVSSGAAITATSGVTYAWQVSDLPPGAGGYITLTARLDDELGRSIIYNSARITATNDHNRTDNSSLAITSLAPGARTMPSYLQSDTYANTSVNQPLTVWGHVVGTHALNGTFRLDFGDGSPPLTGVVTATRFIGTAHTYTTLGLKPIHLIVTDTTGVATSSQSAVRVFPPSRQIEINMAIEKGLLYLYRNQLPDGNWHDAGAYGAGITGFALLAFEENGHLPTNDPLQDIYAETTRRGIDWVTGANAQSVPIYAHHDGVVTQTEYLQAQPLVGNGVGAVVWNQNDHGHYANSAALLGLVGAHRDAAAAQAASVPYGPLAGLSHYELMLQAIDYLAFSQNDGPFRGNWRYNIIAPQPQTDEGFDGSVSQWPPLVMLLAQDAWGLAAPQWVKDNNRYTYASLQNPRDGDEYDGGIGYSSNSSWINTAKTGTIPAQARWWGIPQTHTLVMDALYYLGNHYTDCGYGASGGQGWGGHLYAMFATKKGLQLADIETLSTTVGLRNWYNDVSAYLLGQTAALPPLVSCPCSTASACGQQSNGAWTDSMYGAAPSLGTAWGVLILTQGVGTPLPVAAIAAVSPQPRTTSILLDGAGSFHQNPDRTLTTWLWDWDAADGVDWNHPDASGVRAWNPGYPSLSTRTVTLRVCDDTPATPLCDTTTTAIAITAGNHRPLAVAIPTSRWPFYAGELDENIFLDGQESYDPDTGDAISAYAWDLDGDTQYDDAVGPTASFSRTSLYHGQIGLRVTDTHGLTSTNVTYVDISAAHMDVYVHSLQLTPTGGQVRVAAWLANSAASDLDAQHVLVKFYDAAPFYGNVLGDNYYVDLPINTRVNLSATFTIPDGLDKVYIWLDANNALPENNEMNNQAWDLTTAPVLDISKSAAELSAPPLLTGDHILYTLRVTNTSTGTLTHLVVTDTLPTGVTYAKTPKGAPRPVLQTNPIVWHKSSLAAHTTQIFQVIVKVDGTASPLADNEARATCAQDPTPQSATANLPDPTVHPGLTLLKDAVDLNGPPLLVDDVIRYTLRITNTHTTVTLTHVVVTDTLPAGTVLVSATQSYTGTNTLWWQVGPLVPSATWTADVYQRVDGSVNPIAGNRAAVWCDQQDAQETGDITPPDPGVHYRLTVATGGTGHGVVTPTVGLYTYPRGTVVTLTATPAATATFGGWSGWTGGTLLLPQAIVTMDADQTLTATFDIHTYTLTLATDGTGAGVVTPTPDWSAYPHGTRVTLTATPAPTATFGGWSDGATLTQTTVIMDADQTLTATFTLATTPMSHTLTITTTGSGTGVVTPTVGVHTYVSGTVVSLQATAHPGATFDGWSSAADCGAGAVTLSGARTCTAAFSLAAPPPALAIRKTAAEYRNAPPLLVNDQILYTLYVTNTTASAVTNLIVTDTLPAGVTYVKIPKGAPRPVLQTNPIVWHKSNLAAHTTQIFQVIVKVDGTANPIAGNVAQVSADAVSVQATLAVLPPGEGTHAPGMVITGTASNGTSRLRAHTVPAAAGLEVGTTLTYAITLRNTNGTYPMTGVLVTVTLASGTELLRATPTGYATDTPTLTWTLADDQGPGAVWEATLVVSITGSVGSLGLAAASNEQSPVTTRVASPTPSGDTHRVYLPLVTRSLGQPLALVERAQRGVPRHVAGPLFKPRSEVLSPRTPPRPRTPSATQTLGGTAAEGHLKIELYDAGYMGLQRYTSGAWTTLVYNGMAFGEQDTPDKYSRLQFAGEHGYYFGWGVGWSIPPNPTDTQAVTVTNTRSGNAVTTIWTTAPPTETLHITQTVTYNDGDDFVRYDWDIHNHTGAAITDLRFFHGMDTCLGATGAYCDDDAGAGIWIASAQAVGVRHINGTTEKSFYLQGITAPYAYESRDSGDVQGSIKGGALQSTLNPDPNTDNGYALEWRNASLAAGGTWNITAYERFTLNTFDTVLVTAPPLTELDPGAAADILYELSNNDPAPVVVTLTVTTDQSTWTPTLQGAITRTVPGNSSGSITATVRVTLPVGAAVGATGAITLTADSDGSPPHSNAQATVRVTAAPVTHFTLTLNKTGPLSGTVASSPAGIACGATCAAQFAAGTAVALTAVPSATYTFAGWTGAVISTTNPVTVTMDTRKVITATFAVAHPEITVAPVSLAFGNQDVDAGPTLSQTVTITNAGSADLHVTSSGLTGGDAAHFQIAGGTSPVTMTQDSTHTLQVAFDPLTAGSKAATLNIQSDDGDEPTVNVTLSGTGVDQEITVAPVSLAFGNQDVDAGPTLSQTVTITNAGSADLHVTSSGLTGGDAAHFQIAGGTSPVTMTQDSTHTLQVAFDPLTAGSKAATLSIQSDDSDEPTVNVTLSGTGSVALTTLFRVDADAPGGPPDGLSWTTAFTTLQDALDVVNADGANEYEIWVAQGVYYPDVGGNHVHDAVTETFRIAYNNVQLYGGFAATETQRAARDWATHVTILSGDIDANDWNSATHPIATTWDAIQGANAYHVLWLDGVTNEPLTATTVIDGFTITAGQAAGNYLNDRGGGLYCDGSGSGNACSPTLANLVFSGNLAAIRGGGLLNNGRRGGASSPNLTYVTFRGNQAAIRGGGLFNDGYSGVSNPTLTHVTFSGNQAANGGGLLNYGYRGTSSPTLINVTFGGNQATNGGGMYNDGYAGTSSPALTHVTFGGNHASDGGGGLYNDGRGGGASSPTLVNCILWGNSSSIYNATATPTVTHSAVQWPSGVYTGTGNIALEPLFVASLSAGQAPTSTGNYRLTAGSPTIDAGNNLSVGVSTDRDGYARILDGDGDGDAVVDMGSHEFWGLVLSQTVSPASADPGAAITCTLAFQAFGLAATDVVISDSLPVGISQSGNPPYVWDIADLAPGDSGVLTLTGVLSTALPTGVLTNTATIAALMGGHTVSVTSSAGVLVKHIAGVAFSPDHAQNADASATYTHTLTNTGNGLDNFDLTYHSSQGWPLVYDTPVSVERGQTISIVVNVSVPSAASGGAVDSTVITATSQRDPSVYAVVTATTTVNTYTLTVNTVGHGTVAHEPAPSVYIYGAEVTLLATADVGWQLANWSGDASGALTQTLVTLTTDRVVTATFETIPYTLDVHTVGAGAVTRVPSQTSYIYGDVVTLTATPSGSGHFAGWSGAIHSADNPRALTLDASQVVTATFTQYAPFTHTLTVPIVGLGEVIQQPVGTTFIFGTVVHLTAAPAAGWTFTGWSGTVNSTLPAIAVPLDADQVITATFTQLYTLTLVVQGNGTVALDPAGTPVYVVGTVVTLTATTPPGWTFAGWSGAVSGTVTATTVTMNADRVVTATFAAIPYTLDVHTVGQGTVTVVPSQTTYIYGDRLILTATPSATWYFAGWSGAIGSADNPQALTLDASQVVTATFTAEPPLMHTLTVNTLGQGAVTQQPAGTTFISGTVVRLTAVPVADWTFTGWRGAASGTMTTTVVTLDADQVVTATFTELATLTYTLTVTTVGSGTVARVPPGTVMLPASAVYVGGTPVTLTAMAASGWEFTRWQGDVVNAAAATTAVTMDADQVITAIFTESAICITGVDLALLTRGDIYTDTRVQLSADIAPDNATRPYTYTVDYGRGTVPPAISSADPLGLSYTWTSTGTYLVEIVVWNCPATITAQTATVTVLISEKPAIVPTYTLTLAVQGNGVVEPGVGAHVYDLHTVVPLTATAARGWAFTGWLGDVADADAPVTTLTLDADQTVTATFGEAPQPITITTITPELTYTFSITTSTGMSVNVAIPAGAVSETINLVYQARLTVTAIPANLRFADSAFRMTAYHSAVTVQRNRTGADTFEFMKPLTVTAFYQDAHIQGLDEGTLVWRYFNTTASAWEDDGITLEQRDPANQRLVFTIAHLTEFAIFGRPAGNPFTVYLPLIARY